MNVAHLALDIYLAAVLATAGFAKAENPDRFAAVLRHQRLWPRWSVAVGSWLFPWVEVALAGLLILGLTPPLTAAAVLIVFASFLIIKVLLLMLRRDTDCGCNGGRVCSRWISLIWPPPLYSQSSQQGICGPSSTGNRYQPHGAGLQPPLLVGLDAGSPGV